LGEVFRRTMLMELPIAGDETGGLTQSEVFERIYDEAVRHYSRREQGFGERLMRQLERMAMLRVIDERWREHLYEMDQLKEGIGLRAYGQKNPLLEYKSEGFRMFTQMLDLINEQVLDLIFKAQIHHQPAAARRTPQQMQMVHDSSVGMGFSNIPGESAMSRAAAQSRGARVQPAVADDKIGRNDPCPCGSGKKYKKCHGALQ